MFNKIWRGFCKAISYVLAALLLALLVIVVAWAGVLVIQTIRYMLTW